jgi:predicted methyltransferase
MVPPANKDKRAQAAREAIPPPAIPYTRTLAATFPRAHPMDKPMSVSPHRPLSVLAAAAAAVLIAGLGGCATTPAPDPRATQRYQAVIASPLRTDQDRRMDAARNPAQLLPFVQVQPGMRVLDVSTGGGYTSQLLALAVGPDGVLWAQAPQPGATVTKRLADNPQANFRLVARSFEDPVPDGAPPLDLITIVLNYHDIANLPIDRTKMNARLLAALKPGGKLVVIDHSAKAGTGVADTKTLHRIDEAVVLTEFRQAGFVLDASGDFLRNPADTREPSSGDGRIPTDKFALRFVKP